MKRAHLAPESALPADFDTLHPPWPGEAVLLDGRTTYLRHTPPTTSSAEPALYVHGLGGSSQNWTDMAGLLASRLDGYALDLPGFGRSEPARRYTLAALADRVIRVIEYINAGPVHLFGNSLGGAVSVRVAATRPDLVRTLTLISPAMPFVEAWRSAQGRFVPMLLIPRVERLAARRLAAMNGEELAQQVIDVCWGDPSSVPEQRRLEAIEEANRRLAVPWYADAYVRTFRGLVTSFLRSYLPGSGSLWRLAARVTAPTLVIWGRLDRLVDVSLAPRVANTIPDSRLLIVDEIGHVAQMERPDLVARAVFALLDEVAGAPGHGGSGQETMSPAPSDGGDGITSGAVDTGRRH